MAELLAHGAWVLYAVVALAVIIDLLRRFFGLIRSGVRRAAGQAPPPAIPHALAIELCSFLFLLPPLAVVSLAPAVLALLTTAMLMGFGPHVQISELTHGMVLLCLLVVTFLVVQVNYLMSLQGFWRRVRYLLLLVTLPFLPLALTWFSLDFLFDRHMANAPELIVTDHVSRLLSIGVLPFFMPLVHARLVTPVLTWASAAPGERWRTTVRYVGNALFVLATTGIFIWFGYATGHTRFARAENENTASKAPAAIGIPHTCESYYPRRSIDIGEEGDAIVAFRITTVGTVKDIVIVKSTGFEQLDLATALCVSHWTYVPARADGHDVETPWKARVVWKLR